jgi:hypothetical protein
MKKILVLQSAFLAAFTLFVSCVNHSSTDLGSGIINTFDSTITPVGQNIKSLSGTFKVDSSFSMRDVGDSIIPGLQRNPPLLAAGTAFSTVAAAVDSAIAYMVFTPGIYRQSGSSGTLKALQDAIIDSVSLCFRRERFTSDSAHSPNKLAVINVDSCAVQMDSLGRDSLLFNRNQVTLQIQQVGISTDSATGDTDFTVSLNAYPTYVDRIKKAVKPTIDSASDTAAFAFCFKPATGSPFGIVRFDNLSYDSTQPRLVIYYRPLSDTLVTQSTVLPRNRAAYSVFEADSSAACNTAVSSWETVRRAVFKLDVSSLKNFMDTAAGDGKKFVVVQRANVTLNFSPYITDLFLTTDSLQVLYSVFDTLQTTKDSFATTGSFYIKPSDTSHVLLLATQIQSVLFDDKKTTAFLYLMLPTQNSTNPPFAQVQWRQPATVKFNAIVTNPQ